MSKTYGKTELIGDLAAAVDLPRNKIDQVLQELGTIIQFKASEGRTVVLPGVGRFAQKTRAARTGRNPATGVPIDIPESKALTFKASKSAS